MATGLALGIALLVAGCTGAAQTGPTNAPASPPSPSAATAPPSESTGPSAGFGTCPSSDLAIRVVLDPGRHAAGSTYYPIVFTNKGTTACTLYGYPGVSFVSGQGGSQIGQAAKRNGQPPTTVTLAAGGDAQATLQIADSGVFDPTGCQATAADTLRVFPPGEKVPLYVAFTPETGVCAGTGVNQLTVGPVSATAAG